MGMTSSKASKFFQNYNFFGIFEQQSVAKEVYRFAFNFHLN